MWALSHWLDGFTRVLAERFCTLVTAKITATLNCAGQPFAVSKNPLSIRKSITHRITENIRTLLARLCTHRVSSTGPRGAQCPTILEQIPGGTEPDTSLTLGGFPINDCHVEVGEIIIKASGTTGRISCRSP